MDAISYAAARQNLAATISKVIDEHEPVIITRPKAGAVVMMSLDDFNSLQETMYLLGGSANSEHLRKSIADLEAGKGVEVRLED
jgi:antitoxin YefM